MTRQISHYRNGSIGENVKPYSRRRAYYDGLLNGGLIGLGLGFLLIFSLLNDAGVSPPLNILYFVFGLLVFGISLTAYDAHKAVSAP